LKAEDNSNKLTIDRYIEPRMSEFYSSCMQSGGMPGWARNTDAYKTIYLGTRRLFQIWTPHTVDIKQNELDVGYYRIVNLGSGRCNARANSSAVLLPGQSRFIITDHLLVKGQPRGANNTTIGSEYCVKSEAIDKFRCPSPEDQSALESVEIDESQNDR
jgi:hypothetical protein